jgi:hypothetical protein
MENAIMTDAKAAERRVMEEKLEVVRAKLHATGATVLTPTAEWTALRKEMLELNRKLR